MSKDKRIAYGLLFCLCAGVHAAEIAIIVDDVGSNRSSLKTMLAFPTPVAISVLPMTPWSKEAANAAHRQGRDVLLHAPMEAENKNELLGPGALRSSMSFFDLLKQLRRDIVAVPGVIGINHHMGSRLTSDINRMRWVMLVAKWHGLFYVDSRTTSRSTVPLAAREWGVPFLERQVFLDDDQTPEAINRQFDRLLDIARKRGFALAIGHPHPATLAVLANRLQRLKQDNVHLISVHEAIARHSNHAPSNPTVWSRLWPRLRQTIR